MRRFRAPGRVNLMGDHTDYNEGFVLPMAIDRECVVAASPREDGRIHVSSGGQTADVAADGSGNPRAARPEWARFVVGVAHALASRGHPSTGMNAEISSTIPQGAGLASSAAFEVAVALALCDISKVTLEVEELARVCQEAEHVATGVPSGIMDQLASLAGVANAALLIDCRSLERQTVPIPDNVAVLVVHSGVSRRLEHTAYAERRAACDAAAKRIGVRALRDATLADIGDDPIARHVVTENDRVHRTAQALHAGDLATVGALFGESHASLRDDFRVSTPKLDVLVHALEDAGAYGARLTGAGFGGAVVAIADAARVDELARAASAISYVCCAVAGAGPPS